MFGFSRAEKRLKRIKIIREKRERQELLGKLVILGEAIKLERGVYGTVNYEIVKEKKKHAGICTHIGEKTISLNILGRDIWFDLQDNNFDPILGACDILESYNITDTIIPMNKKVYSNE